MKLIGYLSNGYPTFQDSKARALRYVENGVEIIEADFPAEDPYLDNALLKKRIAKARENSTNFDDYMDAIIEIHNELPNIDILVNIYEKTLMKIGIDNFVKFMKKIEENTVLLAGNEFPELRDKLEDKKLFVSSFVTREMKEEELKLAEKSNGFIYLQGFGDESTYSKKYPSIKDCAKKVREVIGNKRKIYCGIGVHTPELLEKVSKTEADGVFLGSMVIKKEDNLNQQKELLRKLKKIADKSGDSNE